MKKIQRQGNADGAITSHGLNNLPPFKQEEGGVWFHTYVPWDFCKERA